MPSVLRSKHEQLIRRPPAVLELGERSDRLRIAHRHPATLARLRDEVEMNLRTSQRDVFAPERGEANVAVVASVAVPADTEQTDVEQSDRQCERPIAIAVPGAE